MEAASTAIVKLHNVKRKLIFRRSIAARLREQRKKFIERLSEGGLTERDAFSLLELF